jgi:branched-chain amino acid transport system ATP-binding protein
MTATTEVPATVPALAALEVKNLEVTYSRVIVAVRGVSLTVPGNSIVALLGTNGAGKSTTVRAISGFLPMDDAEIKKGLIRFDGKSVLGLPPYQVARRGIVLVPERRKIFETLSVWDNLRLSHGRSGDLSQDRRTTRSNRWLSQRRGAPDARRRAGNSVRAEAAPGR